MADINIDKIEAAMAANAASETTEAKKAEEKETKQLQEEEALLKSTQIEFAKENDRDTVQIGGASVDAAGTPETEAGKSDNEAAPQTEITAESTDKTVQNTGNLAEKAEEVTKADDGLDAETMTAANKPNFFAKVKDAGKNVLNKLRGKTKSNENLNGVNSESSLTSGKAIDKANEKSNEKLNDKELLDALNKGLSGIKKGTEDVLSDIPNLQNKEQKKDDIFSPDSLLDRIKDKNDKTAEHDSNPINAVRRHFEERKEKIAEQRAAKEAKVEEQKIAKEREVQREVKEIHKETVNKLENKINKAASKVKAAAAKAEGKAKTLKKSSNKSSIKDNVKIVKKGDKLELKIIKKTPEMIDYEEYLNNVGKDFDAKNPRPEETNENGSKTLESDKHEKAREDHIKEAGNEYLKTHKEARRQIREFENMKKEIDAANKKSHKSKK